MANMARKVPTTDPNNKRQLLKSVSIREIKSTSVPIEGGGQVDIGVHAQNQIKSILREYGFYKREAAN